MTRNKNLTVLVSCALLIAIEIVLSRFLSLSTPIVRISFGFAPLALSGILFGPWYACAVGALSDFLGANLIPTGPYWPGFTVITALTGLTYGLLLHNKSKEQWSRSTQVIRVAIAVLFVNVVFSLGLNTLNLMLLLDKGFWALLPGRLTKTVVMIPVEFITINALCRLKVASMLRPAS